MKFCILCGINKVEVPDRNREGRPVKRVCRPCHADRLRGDLETIQRRRQKLLSRFDNDIKFVGEPYIPN